MAPGVQRPLAHQARSLMPALADIEQLPIRPAADAGRPRPAHPSPSRDGLALEVLSARELAWWGQRFGVDTPYLMVALGWGEWEPLTGGLG